MRRVALQRQAAEFVDDQQLWLRQREQFLVQAPLTFSWKISEQPATFSSTTCAVSD